MIETQGPQGQRQMNVDMSQTSEMKCDECENLTFKQTIMLRKVSAIVSPNGQETIIPMAVFACESCNHVNDEFKKAEME